MSVWCNTLLFYHKSSLSSYSALVLVQETQIPVLSLATARLAFVVLGWGIRLTHGCTSVQGPPLKCVVNCVCCILNINQCKTLLCFCKPCLLPCLASCLSYLPSTLTQQHICLGTDTISRNLMTQEITFI